MWRWCKNILSDSVFRRIAFGLIQRYKNWIRFSTQTHLNVKLKEDPCSKSKVNSHHLAADIIHLTVEYISQLCNYSVAEYVKIPKALQVELLLFNLFPD